MRRFFVVFILLGMFSACGASPAKNSPGHEAEIKSLDDAAATLRNIIDATATEVFPGIPIQPQQDASGRGLCDAETGDSQDEDYSIFIEMPSDRIVDAVNRTQKYWESEGYEVTLEGSGRDVPRLYSQFDGFDISLHGNIGRSRVYLSGTTPCFSPG